MLFFASSLFLLITCLAYGAGGSQDGGQYKESVDLPQTGFGMKANAVQREPEIQKLWEDKQILQKMMEKNTGVCLAFSHATLINLIKTISSIIVHKIVTKF